MDPLPTRPALVAALMFTWVTGCVGMIGGSPGGDAGTPPPSTMPPPPSTACAAADAAVDGAPPPDDQLTPERLLRRAALALRGTPPTDAEYAALAAAGDPAARFAAVDAFVDRSLAAPTFYQVVFERARDWLNIPLVPNTADEPEYGARQQRVLSRCPASSPYAGDWEYLRQYRPGGSTARDCDGTDRDGAPVVTREVEPWWAPGTRVTLVGAAASDAARGEELTTRTAIDCNGRPEGTCGCGPHAVRCYPNLATYAGWPDFMPSAEHGQRRMLSEEPARLFAHIAWHDRAATDLILGTYSVGPVLLQAAYVMQGIEGGALDLLADDSWWNPARFGDAPVDPDHTQQDEWAWREYQVPARNPFFLADRNYRFDPRTEPGPMRGFPAAGMLTSLGFLDAYPRERLRGARALETLACEVLAPPSAGQMFNPYQRDPAREGPCQNCHRRVDPAAIHFKRWAKSGNALEGYGAQYFMPGIGTRWHWPAAWRTRQWPYVSDPFLQWVRWYQPDSAMTPVTAAQADANAEALFIDFLPPDQTLLGQTSDGTVGPLGFARMIVNAGAYDRCVVRQLHRWVIGRDVDATVEVGYLDALTTRFVADGRHVRSFVKYLTTTDLFRRGF